MQQRTALHQKQLNIKDINNFIKEIIDGGFYEIYGDELIPVLIALLDPLKLEFDLIGPEA